MKQRGVKGCSKSKIERIKTTRREALLKSRYGINISDYDKMFEEQNGKCAICGRPQNNFQKRLGVDHNHKTKYIRGLLCQFCNSKLLRYLRDSKILAVGLVNYLQKSIENDKEWV